jgi:hypothetical protein
MKKLVPGLLAVIVAISLSAFTMQSQHNASLSGEKWFVFNGTDPADLNDPSMYSLDQDGSSPTVCQVRNLSYRCEILAQPSSGNTSQPNISSKIDETKRDTP